eukprot:15464868-Alexandrium_andersonii.AAC.1
MPSGREAVRPKIGRPRGDNTRGATAHEAVVIEVTCRVPPPGVVASPNPPPSTSASGSVAPD